MSAEPDLAGRSNAQMDAWARWVAQTIAYREAASSELAGDQLAGDYSDVLCAMRRGGSASGYGVRRLAGLATLEGLTPMDTIGVLMLMAALEQEERSRLDRVLAAVERAGVEIPPDSATGDSDEVIDFLESIGCRVEERPTKFIVSIPLDDDST